MNERYGCDQPLQTDNAKEIRMVPSDLKRRSILGLVVLLLAASLGLSLPEAATAQALPADILFDWNYYNSSGWLAFRRGDLRLAEQSFRLAIETLKPYQRDHSQKLARSYVDYARTLHAKGRSADAEPLAHWALQIYEKAPGDGSIPLRENLELMVQICWAQDHLDDTLTYLKQKLALQEATEGMGGADLIPTLDEMIAVYNEKRDIAAAEPIYKRSQALRELTAESSLKKAEELEARAGTFRDLLSLNPTTTQSQIRLNDRIRQVETEATKFREATSDSISSAESTETFAKLLQKVGRTQEADSLMIKAKAIRDIAETKALKMRASR